MMIGADWLQAICNVYVHFPHSLNLSTSPLGWSLLVPKIKLQ